MKFSFSQKSLFLKISQFILSLLAVFFLLIVSLIIKKKRKQVIFGSTPIIDYKYWSNSLNDFGIESKTLMKGRFKINKDSDFDIYFDDLIPIKSKFKFLNEVQYLFFIWPYIIRNGRYLITNYNGFVFKNNFWKFENVLLKLNDIKVIHFAYGSDAYIFNEIVDKSTQNSLLIDYKNNIKNDLSIQEKKRFWSIKSDLILAGFMNIDGFKRWDITTHKFSVINTSSWEPKHIYSQNNGFNGVVNIIHSPNHRGCKGTEL